MLGWSYIFYYYLLAAAYVYLQCYFRLSNGIFRPQPLPILKFIAIIANFRPRGRARAIKFSTNLAVC